LLNRLAESGLDPEAPLSQQWARWRSAARLSAPPVAASGRLRDRAGKLSRLVPIENATMADRSVIQWDKDDLDELGLMKVDVLALGMLSMLRRGAGAGGASATAACSRCRTSRRRPATYDMICKADTVGVFQIESRAQMSMLPRMKPRTFYDLVIEVAIVRPGPIQGGMVHPYLRRRRAWSRWSIRART
jgi:error-prone DNA polymerase